MGHSNKIKLFSKKLAASLIKNETPSDLETPEFFETKTKAQMRLDIREVERLNLLN